MNYSFFALLAIIALSSCKGSKTEQSYPKDPEDRRIERYGKITGEDGLVLFGGDKSDEESGATGIGVNSYLWRATLDTLSFMPLSSADPFGGVIITDWYEDPESRGERFKINVLITDRKLSTRALKVSPFKQVFHAQKGWQDATITSNIATDLEDKILTRARQLRTKDQ